jgi:menaquinone-9 beta-reductase
MSHPIRSRYDVIVVGARCAGAAVALLLARRGMSVLAVDRASYGADALSTHALMRGGVVQLHRWGLLDRIVAAGTPAIKTASFHYGEREVTIPIGARAGVDALYAPRRTLLDRVLVDAARDAGADVRHRSDVVDVTRAADGRVTGVELVDREGRLLRVAADVVVGADGVRSRVARRLAAPIERRGRHATALVYGYWRGLAETGYRWLYRTGLTAGVIPTNDGASCVLVGVPAHRLAEWSRSDLDAKFASAVSELFPSTAAQVAEGHPGGALRMFAGLTGFVRRSYGPGWALVGDAGFFRDPITAHGITDALRDAELLARTIAGGDHLGSYQAARDALSAELLDASDAVASFEWSLDELPAIHERLNHAMKRALGAIEALDAAAAA